jgi:hypothetical protein
MLSSAAPTEWQNNDKRYRHKDRGERKVFFFG